MTTFLGRIRRVALGRDRSRASTFSSAVSEATRLRPGYLFTEPGPFDAPLLEPVILDPGELPWELRDDGRPSDGPADRHAAPGTSEGRHNRARAAG